MSGPCHPLANSLKLYCRTRVAAHHPKLGRSGVVLPIRDWTDGGRPLLACLDQRTEQMPNTQSKAGCVMAGPGVDVKPPEGVFPKAVPLSHGNARIVEHLLMTSPGAHRARDGCCRAERSGREGGTCGPTGASGPHLATSRPRRLRQVWHAPDLGGRKGTAPASKFKLLDFF